MRQLRLLNAALLPPERYLDTLMLGLSAVEEGYFVLKNLIDGTIHLSGEVLYEAGYHERRLAEYAGQRRLVVFVPGYMQSHLSTYRLERNLGNEVFDAFTYTWSDFPYSQDLHLSAAQLAATLRDLHTRLGADEIALVGHSQGGIIIRTLVQHRLAPELPVRKCLFLSSPHQGTWVGLAAIPHGGLRALANALPVLRKVHGESGVQLLPGSDFLRTLNALPLPPEITFTSIHYAIDPMILPAGNAVLPYPEAANHFVNKVGHAQPLYCSRATQLAITALYGKGRGPD